MLILSFPGKQPLGQGTCFLPLAPHPRGKAWEPVTLTRWPCCLDMALVGPDRRLSFLRTHVFMPVGWISAFSQVPKSMQIYKDFHHPWWWAIFIISKSDPLGSLLRPSLGSMLKGSFRGKTCHREGLLEFCSVSFLIWGPRCQASMRFLLCCVFMKMGPTTLMVSFLRRDVAGAGNPSRASFRNKCAREWLSASSHFVFFFVIHYVTFWKLIMH